MSTGQSPDPFTRRRFLTRAAAGLAGGGLLAGAGAPLLAQSPPAGGNNAPPPPGPDAGKPVKLPEFTAPTERQSGPPPTPLPPSERVGFAVVGLGRLSVEQVLPAFGECKKARLAALVSGDAAKANEIARQYGVPARSVYDYKNYDALRDNPDVQVIYIVLPNSLHAEFTVRGAAAGKHILCEKPMATSVPECETMIAACKKAGKQLMIAYRIQYEPMNRMMQKLAREKHFGAVKLIEGVNGQNQGNPNQWRQKLALAGGGSLPDVGLYCLNTTRFLLGEEPAEVFAQTFSTPGDPRFQEVEENMTFQLRFPSGVLANLATGYGFHESRRYRVHAERGWFGMDPAFSYRGLSVKLSYAEGELERNEEPKLTEKNQFAQEMDHLAGCLLENRTPYTPGEEGLQDHRIMAALYESARENRVVKLTGPALGTPGKLDAFRGPAPGGAS